MHFEFCSRGAAPLGLIDAPQTDGDSDAGEDEATVDDIPAGTEPQNSILKLVKSKIAWATGSMGGLSITSFLSFLDDWRVVAILSGLIVFLVLIVLYERGRKP